MTNDSRLVTLNSHTFAKASVGTVTLNSTHNSFRLEKYHHKTRKTLLTFISHGPTLFSWSHSENPGILRKE